MTEISINDRVVRIAAVDALRGWAIGAMIVYHFAWDLSHFGLISVNISNDLWWTVFARIIAGTFVGLVGVSLVLATRQGFNTQSYLRRLAVIIAAALTITVATYWFIPQSFVFFGILHLIAFASIAALLFLWLPSTVILLAGFVIIALPLFFTHEIFDFPLLWWVGLTFGASIDSIDYVPVFPWFACTLFGIVAGRALVRASRDNWFASWTPLGFIGRISVIAGRWSLFIYLVHQLILFGLLALVVRLLPVDPAVQAESFSNDCVVACRAAGGAAPVCETSCGCVLKGLEDAGLLAAAHSGRMTPEQNNMRLSLVKQCLPSENP